MTDDSTRRCMLQRTALISTAATLGSVWPMDSSLGAQPRSPHLERIRYCLNTSTIRGHKKTLAEEIDLVAQSGYDGIEPWIREITAHVESGLALRDLRHRLDDNGLTVDSAIGFAPWIVEDATERAKGVEQMKRDMARVRQIGGKRIAAPPAGATQLADLDLDRAAERYRVILELGQQMDVTPQLEVWGFSQSLRRLSEVLYVAIQSGRDDALLLPDVYHLFKGGSEFASLALVAGPAIEVMHLNDYPGNIPRETMADRDRVYPGDGVAPLTAIVGQLVRNGFRGTFSLELFNQTYWQQPIQQVLAEGLAKMRNVVAASPSE